MMSGPVCAVFMVIFTNIPRKLSLLFYRMYMLIEHKFVFLANRPKMAHARIIKMLLPESAHLNLIVKN